MRRNEEFLIVELRSALKPLLESAHVLWHLAGGLATDDKGNQQLSDPVTGEVECDRQPRP